MTLSDGLLQADSIVPVDQSFQFNFLGGTLSVAAYGSASTLADLDQFGGTLAPAGNLSNIGQTEIFGQYLMLSTSMAEFDIEGNGAAGTDYDQITVYGNSITEGTIRVNLNGFQPSSGDTFLLIDATGIRSGSPEFDFSNAALTGGLAWDTSNFLIDGTIGVVGESFLLGDVNCDGNVNLLDVQPFVDLIASGGFSIKADINQDGVVNLLDIGPFVAVLSGN